jgi:superfamily I DNA/RNA helicase
MSSIDVGMFEELAASRSPTRGVGYLPPSNFSVEQRTAVMAPHSQSAIVCAGAGAGKTRLLVERAYKLIKSGVSPQKICVVTFTRRAATEMASRLLSRLSNDKRKLPVCGTVHALALSLLTKRGEGFRLASEAVQLGAIAELQPLLPPEFEELTPSELLLMANRAREEDNYLSLEGLFAYSYEEALAAQGLDDFTSLLVRACKLSFKDVFDYVLVDEAQDLSQLQLRFLKTVAPNANFWFIGDPDQAIYSFRGAHASMMHHLQELTGNTYVLSVNYRCAKSIVCHANNVVSFNPQRLDISWKAGSLDQGNVEVLSFDHGDDEFFAVKEWASAAPNRCILGRTQALIAPYKMLGLTAHTVHEAKGLEWDAVWVIGCESALFPHPLAPKEEERRLFYVAMTRAKLALSMSFVKSRSTKAKTRTHRSPSRFLFEAQALQDKSAV